MPRTSEGNKQPPTAATNLIGTVYTRLGPEPLTDHAQPEEAPE